MGAQYTFNNRSTETDKPLLFRRRFALEKHVPDLLAALWAFVFFATLLALSSLVRPRADSNEASRSGFNSGEPPADRPWIRMSGRHPALVAVATVFLVGSLLIFPAVARLRHLIDKGEGVMGLVVVGAFLSTLGIALMYAWKRGDLNWFIEKERRGNS
jgi:NADH-quinone oxidoreductase subunit A